jgi:hypothetical protein
VASLALLSGCAGTSLMNRNRPDELAVTRQPPLVIPPDFALTPPAPGTAASQQQNNSQQQALDAMFGGPAPRSSGETSLLDRAGGDNAELGIRSSAADGTTNVVDKGKTVFDIVAAPEGDGQNAQAAAGGA